MIISSSTCFFSRRPPPRPRGPGHQPRSHLLLVSLLYASAVLWSASSLQVCQAAKVYEGSCSLDSDIVMVEWDAGLRLFFPSSPLAKNRNQRRSTRNVATTTATTTTTTTTTATVGTVLDDDNNGEEDQVVKKKTKQDDKLEHNARRYLREEEGEDNGRNSSLLLNRRILSESGGTTVFPARKCSCSSRYRNVDTSYYCLTLNHENTCRIPAAEDQPIECLKLLSSQSFLRNSWPVAVLWLATMVLYLFTTTGGRFAMRYLCFKISSCFKCCTCFCCHGHRRRRDSNLHDATLAEWPNHRIIDQIIAMQERSERIRFRRGTALGQIGGENYSSRSPQDSSVTYILKTTQFNKKSMSSPSAEETLPVTPCTLSPSSSTSCNGVSVVSGNDDDDDDGQKDHVVAMESGDHDSFSDNDEILCTICLTSIEDGDRVGVLTCDHLFHSECLKAWIKRKNTCPLCQTPNIAKEKEVATNELGSGGGGSSSSSSSDSTTGENDTDSPGNGGETPQQESPMVQQRTSVRSTGVDVSSYRTASTRTRARTRIATLSGTSVQRNLFRGIRDNERSVSSPRGGGGGGGGGSRSSSSSNTTNNTTNNNTMPPRTRQSIQVVGNSTIGVGTVRIRMNHLDSNHATTRTQRESPSQRRERLNRMRQIWNPT